METRRRVATHHTSARSACGHLERICERRQERKTKLLNERPPWDRRCNKEIWFGYLAHKDTELKLKTANEMLEECRASNNKGGYGWAVSTAPCRDNDSQHSADIIEDGQAPICYGPGRVRAPAARFTPYFFVFAVNESKFHRYPPRAPVDHTRCVSLLLTRLRTPSSQSEPVAR